MDNYIDLKPISKLLGMVFFIPSYQRGYRWTEEQVTDLLDDIYAFSKKKNKSEKEFYCLQPIIVKKRDKSDIEEIEEYEVIDGQQRLTTIRILFFYLIKEYLNGKSLEKRYGKSLFTINFETRPECTEFLDAIRENEESNIDLYHIAKSYTYISNWFMTKATEDDNMYDDICDSIIKTLVYNQNNKKEEGIVQVIWYEIKDENTNPIDTFIRINLGKITLTNAELIKALFLQERNFGNEDIAKLKQLEIAQKWDRIENQMQEENFWWFLNKEDNKSSSHIEFIFDMICNSDDIKENIGNDKNRTFRYYAYRFGNNPNHNTIKNLWSEIETKFEILLEWYLNVEWYHYIGFLIYCDRSIQEIMHFLTNDSILTKEDVTIKLIDEIKKEFKHIKWIRKDEEEDFHINLTYDSKKEDLRKFFLLFNLEYINQQSANKTLIYYFPFKSFKVGKGNKTLLAWDIEHVNSATENSLETFEDQKEWLKNAQKDITEIPQDLNQSIELFLNTSKNKDKTKEKFEALQNEIIKLAKEHDIPDDLKNCIGNLTLLDAGTNRGYGNSLFSTKRRIIIEKDKEGTFIPLCTKNVFLKYFDGNVQSQWTKEDIEAYRKILENTMAKFLPNKETE
jgi:hypothetical protein